MDRRSFIKMLVGGVATAAAVRTFPFRVFSFPKEVVVPPLSLEGLPYWEDGAHVGMFMGIQRVSTKTFRVPLRYSAFDLRTCVTEAIPKDELHLLTPIRDELGRITGSRVDKIINIGSVSNMAPNSRPHR